VRRPAAVDPVAAIHRWLAASGAAVVLVLDAVAAPVNVGAALRNARAFGAAGVVIAAGADPLSPRAVRASVGHVFAQPWCLAASVDEVLEGITPGSVPIWAATVDAEAVDVATLPAGPGVLLVGSEGPGLSRTARARADVRVTIPLAPDVDSLNAAAATAVLLYALRARGSGQPA
jgi:tRNA G18 (ribose-2'-O)-methylase SpoU